MAEAPTSKPALQKPPGFRDPAVPPPPSARPRPPIRRTQPLPPAFRQPGKALRRHHRRRCCRSFCCCLVATVLAVVLLLAVAGAAFYLWFQPRLPAFRIESIQAVQFNVTAKSAGTYLDTAIAVRVLASNPNGKIGLAYGDGSGSVTAADDDGDVPLGSASIAGFRVGTKNSTVVRFSAAAKAVLVDDVVGSRLRTRFKSGAIQFAVELRTRVGFRIWGKTTRKMPIRVLCGAVSVKQASGGGTQPKCKINLLRWINLH